MIDVDVGRRDAHPVADRGEVRRGRRLVTEAPADFRPAPGAAVDAVQPALLLDDARPGQACAGLVAFVLLNLLFEETVPAPTFE